MIRGSSAFNDILEKKYKILRTSLILGNSKNRDDLLLQFEDTARRVDDIRNDEYLEVLASKKYPTKSLKEEEDRLKDLIDFIKKRIYDRKCFLEDYKQITLYNLDGLEDISEEIDLPEYENRLNVINEYLANVDKIEEISAPKELGLDSNLTFQRVSIFLNVFNVHVQRIPISGKITKLEYVQGKFLNITNDKYHEDNERQLCLMKTDNGSDIAFVQIAGQIAKRIVCYLKEGQEVQTGERFGCIKFGSRVDVYLPKFAEIKVKVGQTMIAGETVVAVLK